METLKLTTIDPFTKRLFKTAYPAYKGRTFRLSVYEDAAQHNWNSYWDGGTRDYYVFIQLATLKTVPVPQNGTLFDRKKYRSTLPEGIVAVRHTIFCGKDVGLTIIARASDVTPMLAANAQTVVTVTQAMIAQ